MISAMLLAILLAVADRLSWRIRAGVCRARGLFGAAADLGGGAVSLWVGDNVQRGANQPWLDGCDDRAGADHPHQPGADLLKSCRSTP